MNKVQSINFNDFMKGDWKKPSIKRYAIGIGAVALLIPKTALASTADGMFGNVHEAIMNAFDAGVVLVIIFAGAAWGLGHRSKAIEILIGVCCGYILARHAVDIRDFLKGI
ncbi:glycosyltransferase [Lentibacillus sp. Marseille-P4043]|uniref:glycosyltransferase n=1 Tax=Lentibacillus sp. Marseille-P4043 TaxID=2040293 RepID=UPI000D0B1DD8|nr:glycosyltransferase [Lentibacillus sp. Marseille-P4043]